MDSPFEYRCRNDISRFSQQHYLTKSNIKILDKYDNISHIVFLWKKSYTECNGCMWYLMEVSTFFKPSVMYLQPIANFSNFIFSAAEVRSILSAYMKIGKCNFCISFWLYIKFGTTVFLRLLTISECIRYFNF